MDDSVSASKFLSLLLRHRPETIGLELDAQGWADIDAIVELSASGSTPLTRALIERIAATSDKWRFAISADGSRIRANQGHSLAVDIGLATAVPPTLLYHGTAMRFLDSIRAQGLLRGSRQHVHLSADEATAVKVGARHGKPVVLVVASGEMHSQGFVFHRSDNGVWLTDHVPPPYLRELE